MSDALHEYKQKYLDAINASPWIRKHAAILPNEKESLYQFVRDACGGVFVYIPVDAAQQLEAQLAAAKAEKDALLGKIDALEIILQAKDSENAELRKRPTMEEVEAWQQFYGERCGGVPLRDPVFGLESFIEQQRRKEG